MDSGWMDDIYSLLKIFNDFIIYKLIFFFLILSSYSSIPWKPPSLFFLFYHPRILQVWFRSPLFWSVLTSIHLSICSTLIIPCLVSLLCFRHVCVHVYFVGLSCLTVKLLVDVLSKKFHPDTLVELLYVKFCVQHFHIC